MAEGTTSDGFSAAVLAVSRAVGAGMGADVVLEELARQARALDGAAAVGVIRLSEGGRLWMAKTVGMSDESVACLRELLLHEATITARAVAERRPRVVPDIGTDAFYDAPAGRPARVAAAKEGFCALLSVPLVADDRCLGTVNLYRRDAYEWAQGEIERLMAIAEHSAVMIGCADRDSQQRRRIDALLSLSDALRRSSHEYANRLHVLSGMLAMGNVGHARRFLDELVTIHHDDGAAVGERIRPAALAGLLLAQMGVARARGVELTIDRSSAVDALPAHVSDAGAVTILGNLVDNAIDAAAAVSDTRRRRVAVGLEQTADEVVLVVRDHGVGIPARDDDLVTLGWSTKPGHAGIGLALASDMVAVAGGTLQLQRLAEGTVFTVRLPMREPAVVSRRRRPGPG